MSKLAVITGGSRGIGKAIAKKLAKEDYNLVINYNSSEDRALEVKKDLEEKFNIEVQVIQCDVSDYKQVRKMYKKIKKSSDSIDILINNAGITKDNLILRMKEKEFDQVIDINLKGTFNCCKIFGKHMLKQRSGKIVNIASIVGIMGNPGQSNYAASKAGVIGLTKSLAKEFSSRSINVNAVAPGFIKSDMTDKLDEKTINHYKENIPLGDLGKPEDVAKVVNFLCSDQSDYITGQVINVDGGLLI
ncbi:MAG: 3-oxoacyl-[acyl-carrier-protein] reductase [Bacillota bacterium]